MLQNKDNFEIYLEYFPDAPSLVLVRSVELKNFPKEFIRQPVLDLCCGDGLFSKSLGLREIYGCDIDESIIKKAKDSGIYKDVKVCDARNLSSYRNDYFQTVMANCALEHVDGIDKALASIVRVLKTGGHLIMSVPSENLNKWYLPKIFFEKIGFKRYGDHILGHYNERQSHLNIYSKEDWSKNLKIVGLEVVRHFFLFNEREYKIGTFLDSLGRTLLRKFYRVFLYITPSTFRKSLWRKFLKPIYINSTRLESGGELVIVAVKK